MSMPFFTPKSFQVYEAMFEEIGAELTGCSYVAHPPRRSQAQESIFERDPATGTIIGMKSTPFIYRVEKEALEQAGQAFFGGPCSALNDLYCFMAELRVNGGAGADAVNLALAMQVAGWSLDEETSLDTFILSREGQANSLYQARLANNGDGGKDGHTIEISSSWIVVPRNDDGPSFEVGRALAGRIIVEFSELRAEVAAVVGRASDRDG